jgi:hypothetical protein
MKPSDINQATTELSLAELKKKWADFIWQFPNNIALKSPAQWIAVNLQTLNKENPEWKKNYSKQLDGYEKQYPGLKEAFQEFDAGHKKAWKAQQILLPTTPAAVTNEDKASPELLWEVLQKLKIEKDDLVKRNPSHLLSVKPRVDAIQTLREKLLYGPTPTLKELKEQLSELQEKMTSSEKHAIHFKIGKVPIYRSMQSLFGKWAKVTGYENIGKIVKRVDSRITPPQAEITPTKKV